MQELKVSIQGISPLLFHNGQLANPLCPISLAMKKFTAKRQKTESDHLALSQLEWIGGLYTSDDIEFAIDGSDIKILNNPQIVMPGLGLESALSSAGKKLKLGKHIKAGVFIPDDAPLIFGGDGDTKLTLQQVWDSNRFCDVRAVRVQSSRLMRTRPYFKKWGCEFVINYEDSVIDKEQLIQVIKIGGKVEGMFDGRPRYGRYQLVSAS